jgi:hypothetical protein
MTDPISFTSATSRFSLPFLFAAQAQKEFFVNEALARADALLHPVIESELNAPPAAPVDGKSWLVGAAPTGDWEGHAGEIASRQTGEWLFAKPAQGMQVFDLNADKRAVFDGIWKRAAQITQPSGGSIIDVQARTAIAGLIAALVSTGILA